MDTKVRVALAPEDCSGAGLGIFLKIDSIFSVNAPALAILIAFELLAGELLGELKPNTMRLTLM